MMSHSISIHMYICIMGVWPEYCHLGQVLGQHVFALSSTHMLLNWSQGIGVGEAAAECVALSCLARARRCSAQSGAATMWHATAR